MYINNDYSIFSSGNFRYSVNHIVTKLAVLPMAFEIGSAKKTPLTPKPIVGSHNVKGTTMITFRNIEKNTALFAHPNAVNVDCAENCNAIKKKPKK